MRVQATHPRACHIALATLHGACMVSNYMHTKMSVFLGSESQNKLIGAL